jgi:hypothetical protein
MKILKMAILIKMNVYNIIKKFEIIVGPQKIKIRENKINNIVYEAYLNAILLLNFIN